MHVLNKRLKYFKPRIIEKKIKFSLLFGIFDNFPEEVCGNCLGNCQDQNDPDLYCQQCTGYSYTSCGFNQVCRQ